MREPGEWTPTPAAPGGSGKVLPALCPPCLIQSGHCLGVRMWWRRVGSPAACGPGLALPSTNGNFRQVSNAGELSGVRTPFSISLSRTVTIRRM